MSTPTERSLRAPSGPRIQPFWTLTATAVALFGIIALLSWGSGVSAGQSILISLALLWQSVGGALLWQRVRAGAANSVELVGAGSAVGTAIAVIFAAAANSVLAFTWWWAVPTVLIALGVRLFPDSPNTVSDSTTRTSGWHLWAPILSFIAIGFIALTINFRRYALDGTNTNLFHPDMLFFEALARSTAQYGGSESAFLAGESIRYHWLVYAWAGELTNSFNLDPFVMLTRVLPLFVLVISVTATVAWVRTLTTQWWVPWLATALLVTGGYFGAVNGTVLNFDSPSQSLTALWLIALILLVTQWLRNQAHSNYLIGSLVLLLSLGLAAGKGSAGAVAVGGFGIAAALGIVFLRREPSGRVLVRKLLFAFALSAVAFGLSYVLLLSGNASSGGLQFLTFDGHASTAQGLDSSPTNRGVILGTLGLLLAMSARFIGILGWFTVKDERYSPEVLIGIGLVISGLIPVVIFSESINETWFALAVSAPLSVISAVGVGIAVRSSQVSLRMLVPTVLVAAVIFVAVSYVWTDQVWESGFGRFYAPWLGWFLAGVIGLMVAVLVGGKRFVSALTACVIVLTAGAALSRFTPAVAAALGGAREGVGVGVADFADLPVRNSTEGDGKVEVIESQPVEATTPEVVADTAEVVPELSELFYWDQYESSWSSVEMEFALELQKIVPGTDLIGTNDLFFPLVPALSERMTYLSAARYQELYGTVEGNTKIPPAKESIRQFFADPNALTAQPLCAESVKWLWLTSVDPAAYLQYSGLKAELVAGENALIPMPEDFCTP